MDSPASTATYLVVKKCRKRTTAPGSIPSMLLFHLNFLTVFLRLAMMLSMGRLDICRQTSSRSLVLDLEHRRSEDPMMNPYTAAHSAFFSYCSRPSHDPNPSTSLPPANRVDAPPVDGLVSREGVPVCLIFTFASCLSPPKRDCSQSKCSSPRGFSPRNQSSYVFDICFCCFFVLRNASMMDLPRC